MNQTEITNRPQDSEESEVKARIEENKESVKKGENGINKIKEEIEFQKKKIERLKIRLSLALAFNNIENITGKGEFLEAVKKKFDEFNKRLDELAFNNNVDDGEEISRIKTEVDDFITEKTEDAQNMKKIVEEGGFGDPTEQYEKEGATAPEIQQIVHLKNKYNITIGMFNGNFSSISWSTHPQEDLKVKVLSEDLSDRLRAFIKDFIN